MYNLILSWEMQVLELGIVVHSVVIGLGLGASNNTCTIKGLIAALCFHQMFEGMGLGGCIQQVYIYQKEHAHACIIKFSISILIKLTLQVLNRPSISS